MGTKIKEMLENRDGYRRVGEAMCHGLYGSIRCIIPPRQRSLKSIARSRRIYLTEAVFSERSGDDICRVRALLSNLAHVLIRKKAKY